MKNLLSLQPITNTGNIMATTITRSERVRNINEMISQVSTKDLPELERQINLFLIMLEARRLKKSVKKNTLTMKEIVEEVKAVRHGK